MSFLRAFDLLATAIFASESKRRMAIAGPFPARLEELVEKALNAIRYKFRR